MEGKERNRKQEGRKVGGEESGRGRREGRKGKERI